MMLDFRGGGAGGGVEGEGGVIAARVANLDFCWELVHELLRDGCAALEVVRVPLPEHARLVHAAVNERGQLRLTIGSAAYAPVGPGESIPEAPVPYFSRRGRGLASR